ncbi:hypothetical protein CPA45_21465, partial [Vreelandella nigrificans]
MGAMGLPASLASADEVEFSSVTTVELTVSGTALLSALEVAGGATLGGDLVMSNHQITGLAAGTANDHAVNLGQLTAVRDVASEAQSTADDNASDIATNTADITTNANAITTNSDAISTNADAISVNADQIAQVSATASAGWDISAEGGAAGNVAPGGSVDFSGDGNIEVGRSDTDLTFSLADEIEVERVTAGNTTLDDSGLTISDGPSVTSAGIDAGDIRITNIADGEINVTSQDAVTGRQVQNLFFEEGTAFGIRYFRTNSTAPDSQAEGVESVAIGPNTVAEGASSFAAGDSAVTTGTAEGAIAVGQGATAGGVVLGGRGATAVGRNSEASSDSSVALGDGARAIEGNATALGAGAAASGGNSIAIGDAEASADNTFAAGSGAYAGSPGGIALGMGAGIDTHGDEAGDKTHHIAIGTGAGQNVDGNQTTAIGHQAGARVTGDHNVAVGSHAGENLQGDFNIAIGHEANRNAGEVERATAVGGQTNAARNAVALGYGAEAGDSGVALGANTTASSMGVALGRNASADGGSIALGSSSVARSTDAEGTGYLTGSAFTDGTVVSVGNSNDVRTTRRIVNVADGAQDYDAVNVRQLQSSQQSVANLVGGGVTVEDDGTFGGYVIELQDTNGQSHQYTSVAQAINAVSSGDINVQPGNAVIYNANGTITVAEGVVGSDAVNVGQLNEAIAENGVKYFSVNSSETANRDNAEASGIDAIAIGPATSAGGGSSLAGGHLAHTVGDQSVALGYSVEALGDNSTVVGSGSDAYGDGSVAIGLRSKSQGENSIVMGTDAQTDPKSVEATVDNAIVMGTRAESTADNGIAIGESTLASEERAVAQGYDAHAMADDAQAFGSRARASGVSAQASGTNASASGENAQASGSNASASGYNAIATGTGAIGYATDGIALGTGAVSGFDDPLNLDPYRNTGGVAVGDRALADSRHALALGVDASAEAESATAIGDSAEATAEDALAVGSDALATAQSASAFGQGAEAVTENALAVGSGARATALNASAFGQGAQALHEGSVALGSGAITAAPIGTSGATIDKVGYDYAGTNPVATVSVGDIGQERTITNLAAGRVTSESTDAINGSQLYQTNQAVDALGNDLDTAGNSVANVLGGDATYDPDSHQVTMSNVGGTGENSVHDAIEYAAQGWNVQTNGDTATNVAPGDTVQMIDGQNIAITRNGTDITVATADDVEFSNVEVTENLNVAGDTHIGGSTTINENLTVAGETRLGDNFFVNNEGNVTYDGAITEGNHIVNKEYVDSGIGDLADTPITFGGDTGSTERQLGERLDIVTSNANLSTEVTDDETLVIAMSDDLDVNSVTTNTLDV